MRQTRVRLAAEAAATDEDAKVLVGDKDAAVTAREAAGLMATLADG